MSRTYQETTTAFAEVFTANVNLGYNMCIMEKCKSSRSMHSL